jgi:hypothetical protein
MTYKEYGGQSKMKKNTRLLFLPIVVSIAVLLPASLTPNLFSFKPFGLDEVFQLLTFLIIISLFLERALEVFITTWRRPKEERIDNQVQSYERRISELKTQIETRIQQPQTVARTEELTSENPTKSEKRTELTRSPGNVADLHSMLSESLQDLQNERQRRLEYKTETRKIALWTGLFIGLLISGVGIRALETLITLRDFSNQQPIFYNLQVCIFRILDTLLTGGLIAGGSEGIHKIVQVFTAFLEVTRDRIKDRPG